MFMALRNADRDSARVTAVMSSLDKAGSASPTVESVTVVGDRAHVSFVATNGARTRVRLHRERGHWRVTA